MDSCLWASGLGCPISTAILAHVKRLSLLSLTQGLVILFHLLVSLWSHRLLLWFRDKIFPAPITSQDSERWQGVEAVEHSSRSRFLRLQMRPRFGCRESSKASSTVTSCLCRSTIPGEYSVNPNRTLCSISEPNPMQCVDPICSDEWTHTT